MQIVTYRSAMDIDVKFLDEHGFIYKHNIYSNFKNGWIKNPYDRTIFGVGYIGVGKYNTGNAEHRTQEEYVWRGMFERCYGDKYKEKHPAYYGICSVCDEWHDFQVFAEWYTQNIYQVGTERMHLDKDILVKNNKIYSPETCLIVPQKINVMFMKKKNKYGLPNGIKPRANGKYEAKYSGKQIGIYDSVEEAVVAHNNKKKEAIIRLANEYKRVIPKKVYEALLSYEF